MVNKLGNKIGEIGYKFSLNCYWFHNYMSNDK